MQRIVEALHARIPTIVWVGPAGAKAASAGTFITLAANLAYMAPARTSARPPRWRPMAPTSPPAYGQTEADKVMNDAVKYMTGIAQERHPQAVHGP